MQKNRIESFFRRIDWTAFWITFGITLAVYLLTLAPTVTLEDSGELVVASDYLGVPHPPGYPSWTLFTWFFQWIFDWVTFHGHPNPAWAVNFFSAVAGALASGVIAMLISSSGRLILRSLKNVTNVLGVKTETFFCATAGVCGGLLLAFGQGMWSQAVIAEVYSLNILFQSLVLIMLYCWMRRPDKNHYLYIMAFVFGLGLTNHQTLLFMGSALAIAILFRNLRLFRDFCVMGIFYVLMFVAHKMIGESEFLWTAGPDHFGFWFWSLYSLLIPVIAAFVLPRGKTVCFTTLLVLLGLSFYLLMPVASDQNPPMNWGYPRTWEGFMHAITRGQYARVEVSDVLGNPGHFINQAHAFFRDLCSQFYAPVVLLGFLPFTAWTVRLKKRRVEAFWVSAIFLFLAVGSLVISKAGYFLGQNSEATSWLIFGSLGTILSQIFILALFASAGLGLALILVNAVRKLVSTDKNWVSKALLYLLLLGIVGTALAIDSFLLRSLLKHSSEYSGATTAIVVGFMLLPPLFLLGAWILQTAQTKMRFAVSEIGQNWCVTLLIAFLSVGLMFVILQNPSLDIQQLFIGRVQFIQSHAIYALWIGYGLLFIMAYLETLAKNTKITKYLGVALVLMLPFALIYKNYNSETQKRVVGGSEQNGHNYGWQFGNWQLEGARGVKEDLRAELPPEEFQKAWKEYPDHSYPPPMETNAIFFGGTDPGRFVPTYMIYCAKVRSDIYLITQNALADNTYLDVMRDFYGDQIWIPTRDDNAHAFNIFYRRVKSGKIDPGGAVAMKNGRLQVNGVEGVMRINGILTKMIFDHNQYLTEEKTNPETRQASAAMVPQTYRRKAETGLPPKRAFYVEESYAIEWMYPYLTPHGLIMKLNNKPTRLSNELVKQDHDFWTWNTERLLSEKEFRRDVVARKTFSKLRASLGSLYAMRGRLSEAEFAYKQAVELYPLSPEANFRFANLLLRQSKYKRALEIITTFLEADPHNTSARRMVARIGKLKEVDARCRELETMIRQGEPVPITELLQTYLVLNKKGKFNSAINKALKNPAMKGKRCLNLLQFLSKTGQLAQSEKVCQKYLSENPKDIQRLLDLAAIKSARGDPKGSLAVLKRAIRIGGTLTKRRILRDKRFRSLYNQPEFRALAPEANFKGIGNLPAGNR